MFCTECGTKFLKATSKFCSNCGSPNLAAGSAINDQDLMTFELWCKKFRPVENGVVTENEAFGGIFYPTFGPAKTEVLEADLENVWSLISTGLLKPAKLKSGLYQGSDTVGYFVSEVSFSSADDLQVELDDTTVFVGNVPLVRDAKSKKLRPAKYETPQSDLGFSRDVRELDSNEELRATALFSNFENWAEKYQAQFFYYVSNDTYESLEQCDDPVLSSLDPKYFWTCEESTNFKSGSAEFIQPGLYESTYSSKVIVCNRPHEFSPTDIFPFCIVASLIDSFCENCDERAEDYLAEECENCGSNQMLDFGEPLALTFQDLPGAFLRVNIQLIEPVENEADFRRSVVKPILKKVKDDKYSFIRNRMDFQFAIEEQFLIPEIFEPGNGAVECVDCGSQNATKAEVCFCCGRPLVSEIKGKIFASVLETFQIGSEAELFDRPLGELCQFVDIYYFSTQGTQSVVAFDLRGNLIQSSPQVPEFSSLNPKTSTQIVIEILSDFFDESEDPEEDKELLAAGHEAFPLAKALSEGSIAESPENIQVVIQFWDYFLKYWRVKDVGYDDYSDFLDKLLGE